MNKSNTLSCPDRETAIKNIGGNIEAYNRHLIKFRDTYKNSAGQLAGLIDSGLFNDAAVLAHSIKGLSGTLGLPGLYAASATLEASLKSDCCNLQEYLTRYQEALTFILQE